MLYIIPLVCVPPNTLTTSAESAEVLIYARGSTAAPRRLTPISTPLTVSPPPTHPTSLPQSSLLDQAARAWRRPKYAPRVERAVQAPRAFLLLSNIQCYLAKEPRQLHAPIYHWLIIILFYLTT